MSAQRAADEHEARAAERAVQPCGRPAALQPLRLARFGTRRTSAAARAFAAALSTKAGFYFQSALQSTPVALTKTPSPPSG